MTTENYLASENLIFYGTSIVDGEGTGIVVRTGTHTHTHTSLFTPEIFNARLAFPGDGTLLARMIKDSESAKFRKEGGPKAKKAIMKQLAKNGLLFKEPNAASRLGRVTTLVVDAVGVITENKSSVSYIMIDKEIREATSGLPEGEPTYNALQRACVLSCNAFFQVPEGVNKTKLNIDSVDVEEWDNTR
jgi:magnesium-transporting ATPase (P-type)